MERRAIETRTAAPPGSPRGGSPRRASAHLDRAVPLPPALLEALEVRLVLALFLRPEGRTAHGRLRARGRARSSSPRPGGRGFPQRARIGTQPAAGAAGISNPVSKKFGFPSVLFQSGQNEGFLFLTNKKGIRAARARRNLPPRASASAAPSFPHRATDQSDRSSRWLPPPPPRPPRPRCVPLATRARTAPPRQNLRDELPTGPRDLGPDADAARAPPYSPTAPAPRHPPARAPLQQGHRAFPRGPRGDAQGTTAFAPRQPPRPPRTFTKDAVETEPFPSAGCSRRSNKPSVSGSRWINRDEKPARIFPPRPPPPRALPSPSS